MICERCGEVAETFFTEKHGDLCEACQREIEREEMRSPPPKKRRLFDDSGEPWPGLAEQIRMLKMTIRQGRREFGD